MIALLKCYSASKMTLILSMVDLRQKSLQCKIRQHIRVGSDQLTRATFWIIRTCSMRLLKPPLSVRCKIWSMHIRIISIKSLKTSSSTIRTLTRRTCHRWIRTSTSPSISIHLTFFHRECPSETCPCSPTAFDRIITLHITSLILKYRSTTSATPLPKGAANYRLRKAQCRAYSSTAVVWITDQSM